MNDIVYYGIKNCPTRFLEKGFDFSIVVLLLKMYCFFYFKRSEIHSFRCSDKFIFNIVMTMNYSNDTSRMFFDRSIYTKQIHIEFFAITT